jgi:hypothetical protein
LGRHGFVKTLASRGAALAEGGQMAAWINEFHDDNAGTDVGEFVEIAGGAGADPSGWSLVLGNGNGGAACTTTALSGVMANQQAGFGAWLQLRGVRRLGCGGEPRFSPPCGRRPAAPRGTPARRRP